MYVCMGVGNEYKIYFNVSCGQDYYFNTIKSQIFLPELISIFIWFVFENFEEEKKSIVAVFLVSKNNQKEPFSIRDCVRVFLGIRQNEKRRNFSVELDFIKKKKRQKKKKTISTKLILVIKTLKHCFVHRILTNCIF